MLERAEAELSNAVSTAAWKLRSSKWWVSKYEFELAFASELELAGHSAGLPAHAITAWELRSDEWLACRSELDSARRMLRPDVCYFKEMIICERLVCCKQEV